ncbi:MAG: phenylacetate--CoA ligase family protein [Betaproteobacteria bacterium]
MFNSAIYKDSPTWAQELLVAGRALARSAAREGGAFRRMREEIERTQWLAGDALREYAFRQLRATLVGAGRDVPYWRALFARLGLSPPEMALPAELARLPVLTKNDIRDAGERMVSERRRSLRVSGSTSGTTGSPIWLHQDLQAINREHAFVWRQLAWAGMKGGERRAWLRGEMIVPADQKGGPYWRLNRADRMLMMSSFHLSDTTARGYIDELERYDPALIQAYPSSITFLAAWMDNNGQKYRGRSLRGVVTSSETMNAEAQALVARTFGCKVFDWYGLAERVAAIGTCEHGSYHVMSDYSHVETVPAEDGLHELIGTGYNNPTMPLIRYRCGDLVRLAPHGASCECGRAFPIVEEIIGRADDAIKLPDGRRIAACLAGNVFRGVPGILQGQIRQDQRDRLDLYVIPTPGYSAASVAKLRGNVEMRIGRAMTIDVHTVEELPRTQRGKFKAVVCTV